MNEIRPSLEKTSRLGFGAYRISHRIAEHREALVYAISQGCTLIDTASNYMDGQSEELIGEVIQGNPATFVVTKTGYLSPTTQRELEQMGCNTEKAPSISAESKYSLDIDIVRAQLTLSAMRLRRAVLDAVLLHNPEHLFGNPAFPPLHSDFQTQVKRLFEMLEEQVARGSLQWYGVSSDSLLADWPSTIDSLLTAARSVSSSHHFKIVEVPCNLLERQAAVASPRGTLIEFLKTHGLISVAHRPLNARWHDRNYRLAIYESHISHKCSGQESLTKCCELISEQLRKVAPEHQPMDFSVMKFLRDNWQGVGHPDLVDQILNKHFIPFVSHLWEEEIPADVQTAFRSLWNEMGFHARQALSHDALEIRRLLESEGLVPLENGEPFSRIACSLGLNLGFDHVVVGMRRKAYVEELLPLL